MAFVQNFETSDYSLCFLIEKATKLIDKISEMNDCSEQHHRLCSFIQEQLKLIAKRKNQRRYSVDLLLASYIIYATTSEAYERLLEKQILILPSIKALKKNYNELGQKKWVGRHNIFKNEIFKVECL